MITAPLEDLSRLPIERAAHLAPLLASLAAGPTVEVVDHLRAEIDGHLEAHRFSLHRTGDGYTTPREEWASCSCGASLFEWSEAVGDGTPLEGESPEVGYAVHLAAVLLGVYPRPVVVEDPWRRSVLPQHTDPACPELFGVTPGQDRCTCPRPRQDEPPF